MTDQELISIEIYKDDHDRGNGYDQVVFDLQNFVGRGELGAVYKGTAQPDDQPIVVKIPHSTVKNKEAEEEYKILHGIGQVRRDPDQPIGRIARAEYDGKTIIVMPYYRNEDRLIEHIRNMFAAGEYLQAERLAVAAGIHYAETMHALHTLPEPRACTDRKIKDFYLTNNTHYILDWNVLREDVESFRVTEVKLFGFLWHELFYASKGSAPFDPFDDYKWQVTGQAQGAISVGLRELMARAVLFDSAPVDDGRHMLQLRDALTEWSYLIAENALPTAERIRSMLRQFPAGGVVEDQVVTTILRDLEWRLNRGGVSLEERNKVLETTRSALRTGDVKLQLILQTIERDVSRARDVVREFSEKATAEEKISFGRWEFLLNILQETDTAMNEGKIKSYQRDNIRQLLVDLGKALHASPSVDSEVQLNMVNDTLNKLRAPEYALSEYRLSVLKQEHTLRMLGRAFNGNPGWTLNERLNAIGELTNSLGQTGTYFNPSEAVKESLAAQITHDYLLETLRQKVEALNDDSAGVDEVYPEYTQLLALADLQGAGEWVTRKVGWWLEVVSFHQDYTAPLPDTVPEVLLRDVLSRRRRMNQNEEQIGLSFQQGIERVARGYIADAVDRVETALQGRITWSGLQEVNSTRNLLVTYGELKQSAQDRYQRLILHFEAWHSTVAHFVTHPNATALTDLFKLIDHKPEGIDMTDLMGAELLIQYRKQLEDLLNDQLKADVDEFVRMSENLERRLKEAQGKGTTAAQTFASGLENLVAHTQKTLSTKLDGWEKHLQETENRRDQIARKLDTNRGDDERVLERLSDLLDDFQKKQAETLTKASRQFNEMVQRLRRVFDERQQAHTTKLDTLSPRGNSAEDYQAYIDSLLQLADEHVRLMQDAIPDVTYTPERHTAWYELMGRITQALQPESQTQYIQNLDKAVQQDARDYIEQVSEKINMLVHHAKTQAVEKNGASKD